MGPPQVLPDEASSASRARTGTKRPCLATSQGNASALDRESLAHDRAAPGNYLKIGDSASDNARTRPSSRGERSQRSRGGLLQERAEGAGLLKQRLHLVLLYVSALLGTSVACESVSVYPSRCSSK